ncbi:DUF6443 domain-containing protein [Nonlabens ulvanivorans]|uniref:DUF6443 domain-containing protein n=1 Tax=Nonlabens ulvanivorans TaxID=906888 RepID=UPI0037C72067
MRNYITTLALVVAVVFATQAQTPNTNYVKTTAYKVPTQDGLTTTNNANLTEDDKIESISYFDGLGRPTQSIQLRGGANKENIISFHRYDGYGREVKTYLPYATNGPVNSLDSIQDVVQDQLLYYQSNYSDDFTNSVINPFSEVEFEDSPLHRPFKQAAPGSDWAMGSGHEVRMDYQTNGTGDAVRKFGVDFNNYTTATPDDLSDELGKYEPTLIYEGLYGLGQLYKNIVKDENWTPASGNDHTVEEFTDKSGRVILKRTYDSNQAHDTYYVYDDYGNLSFVIPPLASDQIINSTLTFNNGNTKNISWVDLASVDREFADSFNAELESYDNSNILNVTLENEYGGIGGMSVTSHENSSQLSLNINFSVNQPMELINGYVFDLAQYGEYEDVGLGSIQGADYSYTFSIKQNQIHVSGEGALNGLSQSFSNQVQMSHSINFPWVDFVEIGEEDRQNYHTAIINQEIANSQLLTTTISNPYNGLGGLNVSVDANDNVSISMNTSFDTALHLLSGASMPLNIDRMLTDRDLGSITGNGYSYDIELKNNAILITGDGSLQSRVANFTISDPVVEASIDAPTLQGLCYIYEYDYRNRLIEKKIPGKDWEHIVYDILDRPILTQDGNQRANANPEWLFTKYDKLGRVVYTGIYKSTLSRKRMQHDYQVFYNDPQVLDKDRYFYLYEKRAKESFLNGNNQIYYTLDTFLSNLADMDVLTVSYYDDPVQEVSDGTVYTYETDQGLNSGLNYVQAQTYGQMPVYEPNNPDRQIAQIGLPTITEVRTLSTNNWANSATYYDYKARPIHVTSYNTYLGTYDRSWLDIDFIGKTLATTTTHKKASASAAYITVEDDFTYDHMDRMLTHVQKIDNQTQELITSNVYDQLGQLISKKVGGAINGNGLQTVDYNYNIRGWLTDINPFDNQLDDDLFSFSIGYNNPVQLDATPLYNGNISETSWRTASDHKDRAYTYQYDALNRLKEANYIGSQLLAQNVGNNIAGQLEDYTVKGINYDKNGNILTLNRMGLFKENQEVFDYDAVDWVDKLVYTYSPKSNQLIDVIDQADHAESGVFNGGFKDSYTSGENYTYADLNGNMTKDLNKGVTNITYNHLNLPKVVYINGGRIIYSYDATGVKLRKQVLLNGNSTFTFYAGNYIYEQDSNGEELKFFSHPEGYVEKNGTSFDYVYQYKDHLGNIRLNYAQGPNGLIIKEENNYYPFGLQHKGYNNVVNGRDHKYGFGGKEEQDELGLEWIDITARNYDPALGRWMNIDPLAQSMSRYSPYNYAFGNPIFFVDPDGMAPETFNDWYKDKDGNLVFDKNINSQKDLDDNKIQGEHIAEKFIGVDQNDKAFMFTGNGNVIDSNISKGQLASGRTQVPVISVKSEKKKDGTKTSEVALGAAAVMTFDDTTIVGILNDPLIPVALFIAGAATIINNLDFQSTFNFSASVTQSSTVDSASDSSKNERHGDSEALNKVEEQLAALQAQLANATGKEAKKLKQKIQNVKRNAAKNKKGETHSRNAKS